jgi:hypothetical protein
MTTGAPGPAGNPTAPSAPPVTVQGSAAAVPASPADVGRAGNDDGEVLFDPEVGEVGSNLARPSFSTESREHERIHSVYRTIIEIVIYVLLIYFALLIKNTAAADKFATVAVGPVLTILAGAAGYYFGRKD